MGKIRYTVPKGVSSASAVNVKGGTPASASAVEEGIFILTDHPPSEWDWVEVESQPKGFDPILAKPAAGEMPLVGLEKIADFMNLSLD